MSKTKKSANRPTWIGFINVYFNDPEKHEIQKWIDARTPSLQDALHGMCDADMKVSISNRADRPTVQVSLTPKSVTDDYAGYTIGVEHEDLRKCIIIAYYVCSEMLPNGGVPFPDQGSEFNW